MRAWMLVTAALGALVIAPIASGQDDGLERTTLVDVQQTGPAEVELDGDPALEGGCPSLVTLFAFPGDSRFRLPRARRGTAPGSFSASPRLVRGEIQIRTTEGLYRRRDGGCCPSYVRTSDWAFDREQGRYVRLRSRTRRFSSRG